MHKDAPPGGLGSNPERQQTGDESYFNEHNQEVPHWDREAHHRTHETLQQRRNRQANENRSSNLDELNVGGSWVFNFLAVSGIMAVVTGVPAWWFATREKKATSGRSRARTSGGEG